MSIASPNTLLASNQVVAYSKLLQHLSLTEDIFQYLNQNYNTKMRNIPEAIYLTVNDVPDTAHTYNLPMLMPLTGSPTYGNTISQVGREENQITKSVRILKNDYSHALTNQLFGIDAQDKRFYGLLQEETPQLGLYFKEQQGKHLRQALLERYSENLTDAQPTNAIVSSEFGPNWYIKNLDDAAQPAFDQTSQTHINNIVAALNTAGTSSDAQIDFNYLFALEHQANFVKRITPIMIEGMKTYIVTVPSRQAIVLKNPLVTGSWGAQWTAYNRLTEVEMKWPNVLGRFGSLLLVEDPRNPVILPGGTAAPFTLTASYLQPGNNDERSTSVNARDIGFLLGKAAIVKWETEKLHFEVELANTYGKFRGRGAFGTYGIQQVQYDLDTVSNTTREQFSSIILAFSRNTIRS